MLKGTHSTVKTNDHGNVVCMLQRVGTTCKKKTRQQNGGPAQRRGQRTQETRAPDCTMHTTRHSLSAVCSPPPRSNGTELCPARCTVFQALLAPFDRQLRYAAPPLFLPSPLLPQNSFNPPSARPRRSVPQTCHPPPACLGAAPAFGGGRSCTRGSRQW